MATIIVTLRLLAAPLIIASWLIYQKWVRNKTWAELKPDLYVGLFFCIATAIVMWALS